MEKQQNKTSVDFEKSVGELKQIVDRLEGDVSLDEGMKLFDNGLALTEECIEYLNRTKATLTELNAKLDLILGEDGNE